MITEDFTTLIKKKSHPVLCNKERDLIQEFIKVKHSKNDVNKMLANAWTGLYVNEDSLFNPLNNLPPQATENFSQYLVWLMSQPDYFYFIIKCVFQMDSFPFQCLLLRELFNHRYPLVVASRGASKCILGNSLIVTDSGIKRIDELVPEKIVGIKQDCPHKAFGETGYRDIEYSFYNGKKPTKVIKTKSGRKLECTLNHPIRVVRDGEIVWSESKDVRVGDFAVIQRKYEEWNTNDLDKDIAYMVGAMVGDGCYTIKSKSLKFTNMDEECIDNVNAGLEKWKNVELKLVNSTTRKLIDYFILGGTKIKNAFIEEFGCNQYSQTVCKTTPKIIFNSSFKTIAEYLAGLFDTDGSCHTNSPVVELSSKSRQLLEETQTLLITLGINSFIKDQYNKKHKKFYYKLIIRGSSLRVFKDKIKFRIKRKQDLVDKHCLTMSNDNVDLLPKDLVLEKLLKLRELARDIKISKDNGHTYDHQRQSVSPHKLKSYALSYNKFSEVLDILSLSPSVKQSGDYHDLVKLLNENYYYDEVTSIDDSENDTYDIHIDNDDHSFISNGFISHNTSTLGMYILISMIIRPNIKIVITGAGFRQAKLVFQYMEDIWQKSPVLRSCYNGSLNGPKHGTDAWAFRLGGSICYALPVGPDGSKVRGYRANILAADEFSTLNRTVFEEVMSGFLAVSADPIEQMGERSQSQLRNFLPDDATSHLINDDEHDPYQLHNQLILSGTAYYKHNHFYTYYNKWKEIISSGGDPKILKELMGGDYDPQHLNWKDYSIFRVPIELTASGFMDMSQISRIKASTSKDVYAREYSAVFTDDSDGFYRRSIIDSCTVSEKNKIIKNDEEVKFGPVLYGDLNKKYIYGVDPAYEGDNFAIVILECEKNYRKLVHVWTTQASDHKQLLKDGIITENDYYHYAARKIRNLMKRFPCAYIALDTQGGGRAVMEALSDDSKLEENERMILPYVDPTQPPKDSDSLEGDHIIYEIKPSSDWNIEANHSLKKDMEMKDILFPMHDGLTYSMAEFYDESLGDNSSLYDTLEDCIFDIEELKNELTMIVVTETATGKQRFDTPEIKIGITKKGKLKKDRYSAFLMANYVARNMDILIPRRITSDMFGEGGFAKPSVFLTGNNSVGNPSVIKQFESLYDAQMSVRPNR